jgi:hypothetical protein
MASRSLENAILTDGEPCYLASCSYAKKHLNTAYLNKAVMEKKPQKGSGDPWLLGDSLLQDRHHNLISVWACGSVEIW